MKSSLRSFVATLAGSNCGNVILSAAILAPVLLGGVAAGVDYAIFYNQKSALQQAADASALASVKELGLLGSSEDQVVQIGRSYAADAFLNKNEASSKTGIFDADVKPSQEDREVVVDLSYSWAPFLAHLFDYQVTPIRVTATAKLAGNALTCVVGLMPPQSGLFSPKASIHLDNDSEVKADGCAVFSNSTSKYGLRADKKAKMTASTICSAGGIMQSKSTGADFTPQPLTDCPKIDDPLIDRKPPSYSGCDFTNLLVTEDTNLTPGVYCGGLTIADDAEVKLNPGNYIIKDGPLTVTGEAELKGIRVSFFLTGPGSIFEFHSETTIDLSAAETGSMAGLLFFEDRTVPHSFKFNPFKPESMPANVRLHKISSNDARNLLGTIYLPKSVLLIDANAPVADASAYTAIVTGRLWLQEGPVLSLNADLTDTKVPVPDGLMGTEPALVQ